MLNLDPLSPLSLDLDLAVALRGAAEESEAYDEASRKAELERGEPGNIDAEDLLMPVRVGG